MSVNDVKRSRELAGCSQRELARKTGLDQSLISRFERGERAPNRAQAVLIAEALGAPLEPPVKGVLFATGTRVPRDENGVPTERVRRAFACERCGPTGQRVFLRFGEPDRTPACPQHGPMARLQNAPYFGRPTPT